MLASTKTPLSCVIALLLNIALCGNWVKWIKRVIFRNGLKSKKNEPQKTSEHAKPNHKQWENYFLIRTGGGDVKNAKKKQRGYYLCRRRLNKTEKSHSKKTPTTSEISVDESWSHSISIMSANLSVVLMMMMALRKWIAWKKTPLFEKWYDNGLSHITQYQFLNGRSFWMCDRFFKFY